VWLRPITWGRRSSVHCRLQHSSPGILVPRSLTRKEWGRGAFADAIARYTMSGSCSMMGRFRPTYSMRRAPPWASGPREQISTESSLVSMIC